MLQVLIIRDGGAAKIPREVANMEAVEKLREQGFEVEVVEPEALPVETVVYADGTEATGVAPLPEQSPAEQDGAQPEADAAA